MLKVSSNGKISLTRGDTAWLTVDLEVDLGDDKTEPYDLKADDVVTLTVKADYEDEEALIEKKVTGSNEFHIKPADTKNLAFGEYKYDVQVTTPDGDNYTVIENKVFEVTYEVG